MMSSTDGNRNNNNEVYSFLQQQLQLQPPLFRTVPFHDNNSIIIDTETTRLQQETEQECAPFFVELSSLPPGQREHLVQVGLLPADDALVTSTISESDGDGDDMASKVQLLRDKHRQYLQQVWKKKLKAPFVSLDSSRPWILYWCLHGFDLLQETTTDGRDTPKIMNIVSNREGCNMVATLKDCWQSYYTADPPSLLVEGNEDNRQYKDPFYFARHEDDVPAADTDDPNSRQKQKQKQPSYQYYCGGFGGGPGQLAHAATTYAAVLALCILATDDPNDASKIEQDTSSDDDDDDASAEWTTIHYSTLARELLQYVRIPLYRWMVSLQQSHTGGYRMHHDGEVDVRATYTIITCAKLLGLLLPESSSSPPSSSRPVLNRPQVINFVVSCQTYEGGMGGEPFSEAHGGYTFCGVAALKIMDALGPGKDGGAHKQLDTTALLGWLARRQMAYEGGFSGRSNKLVDGCYSFWQGAALAIASSCGQWEESVTYDKDGDPWLQRYQLSCRDNKEFDLPFPLFFDVGMLERYILLCAQEISGGLRDKPSKPRDFYHTCYNLSGLSVAQHCSNRRVDTSYGDAQQTRLSPTHPCYNIRIDRVAAILDAIWTTP
ncbi:prenyltransferase and squalene oxidase repeat domain containing protein [Nitzschia inconspicua]|nr:prenyltransferase and squalene oxidase repeat domain containing protein [Nitzschia inconspicua]